MPPVKDPVFFVIGSTGTGKSNVAICLAQNLKNAHQYKNVVVINCDVYQCFSGLPISTNKPSTTELNNVPHVFLGFLENEGDLSAVRAEASKEEVLAFQAAKDALEGNAPLNVHTYKTMVSTFISKYFEAFNDAAVIICGGTCYYVQALLFSNFLVSEDKTVNDDDDGESECDDAEGSLWQRLNAVDAVVAARYHPHDTRRIKRLLEIHEATGQKPSAIFDSRETKLCFDPHTLFVVWTRMERSALDQALDNRVDQMLDRGMLAEIEAFWTSGDGELPKNSLAEAIGCKEFTQYFAAGAAPRLSEVECRHAAEQVKANTRRYSRQQERWIRNRLLRSLQSTPLKQLWRHFLVFSTDQGAESLMRVKKMLDVFFDVNCEDALKEFEFPLCAAEEARKPVSQEKCDVCDTLVYGRGQMEAHVKSKRHRGALRRLALERKQKELYGRELPPPKKKRSV